MRKNVLILVCAVVLFSLFNTTKTNFIFWDNPEINNDYIIFPNVPISYDNDISLFGLFINFFSDLDFEYSTNTYIEDVKDVIYVKEKGVDDDLEEEIILIPKQKVKSPPSKLTEVIEIAGYDVKIEIEDAESDEVGEVEIIEVEEDKVSIIEGKIEKPINTTLNTNKVVDNTPKVKEKKKSISLKVNKVIEQSLPSDEELIMQNPNIKENAKRLILEALENEEISIEDIQKLLSEHTSNRKKVKKGDVKDMIKKNKKRN